MVKQGLKNYFGSLKYFFTPLGTMFLGMMLGFSVLIPGVFSALSSLIEGIKRLSESVSLDFNELWSNLWSMVTALDWNAPEEALKTLISAEWLNEALTEALSTILGTDFELFKEQITLLVATFISEIAANVFVFFFCWIIGFIAGYVITKYLIRRNIAKRSLGKKILFTLTNGVLTAGVTVLCAYLFVLWQYSIYIAIVLLLVFVGAFALLEAYLMYGVKKIELKTAVNMKNVGLYMLTNLIIFAVSVCISLVAVAINKILGVFIGLSLLVVAFLVISMNAESYIKSLAENAQIRLYVNKDEQTDSALPRGNGSCGLPETTAECDNVESDKS